MTQNPSRSRRRVRCIATPAAVAVAVLIAGCGGGNKKKNASPPPSAAANVTTAVASRTVIPGVPIGTPIAATPTRALTPAATPIARTPAASPTPSVHEENGLQIEDVSFDAVVTEDGGVRIRSAPQVDPSNVVGSLPQGAPVHVEGRVLNGAEAEQGHGTVWCIVGVKQYIYCGTGYISQGGASPTPAR